MDNKEFYHVLIGDLRKASLSSNQIRSAILSQTSSKEDVEIVDQLLKDASWIPSGMTPLTGTGFDFDAEGSYVSRVERNSKDQDIVVDLEEDSPEEAEDAMKRKQLVDELVQTAEICQKKGLVKQAAILDEMLFKLI